jgi:hypothetical protein
VNTAVGLAFQRHSYFPVHQETTGKVKIADALSVILVMVF